MNITVRGLRSNTNNVLDAMEKGASVTITRRGKPAARLVAIPSQATTDRDESWFGMWADREGMDDVQGWPRELRKPRYSLHEDQE